MVNTKKIDQIRGREPTNLTKMGMFETMVGYILLVGVLLSVLFIITGTVWNLIQNQNLTTPSIITSDNFFGFLSSSLHQLFQGQIHPSLLVNLGIATLMLTPYLRVLISFFYFVFLARNLKYSLFTLFVFSVLTYSLFLR